MIIKNNYDLLLFWSISFFSFSSLLYKDSGVTLTYLLYVPQKPQNDFLFRYHQHVFKSMFDFLFFSLSQRHNLAIQISTWLFV